MAGSSPDSDVQSRTVQVRPHVLIVTDDEDLRDFLQEGLILGGFWVSIIASGVQTLEVFRLRSFDLVLVDGALAGLGALELIRRLRRPSEDDPAGGPRSEVPILALMDQVEDEHRVAIAAGADAILTPPLELEQLLPLLMRTVLDWRAAHPGRTWADHVAQLRSD